MNHSQSIHILRVLTRTFLKGILFILILALVGCNMPQSAPKGEPAAMPQITSEPVLPEPAATQPQPAEPAAAAEAQATSQVFLPQVETSGNQNQAETTAEVAAQPTSQVFLPQVENPGQSAPAAPAPEAAASTAQPAAASQSFNSPLAYLNGKNLFLVEPPNGAPLQLTNSGDLLSFAWAPDGSKLATFNGKALCVVMPDGAPASACVDLKLDENQAKIDRRLVWSPDQTRIVLWNAYNPWEQSAIGWLIVTLDGSQDVLRIQNPSDWGVYLTAENEPGGITGQALFLPDGTLVGTLTHSQFCGSGGCHYQLYKFDFTTNTFSAYPNKPEEGFSEGLNLALSKDGKTLVNYGAFNSGCENFLTFFDFYQVAGQTRALYTLDQESIVDMTLAPDATFAVIARSASCSDPNQVTWASTCGLTTGLDLYPLQIWDLANNSRADLLPALSPAWSPNGQWLAFTTCMSTNAGGGWEINGSAGPGVFIRSFVDGALYKLAEGSRPAWRP